MFVCLETHEKAARALFGCVSLRKTQWSFSFVSPFLLMALSVWRDRRADSCCVFARLKHTQRERERQTDEKLKRKRSNPFVSPKKKKKKV
jgi:hypothetical protein